MSEDLKKIREALNHNVGNSRLYLDNESFESAKEALQLFDAHVAALSQQEAEPVGDMGAGDVLALVEDLPEEPQSAYALGFNRGRKSSRYDGDLTEPQIVEALKVWFEDPSGEGLEPGHKTYITWTARMRLAILAAMQTCPPKPAPLPQPVSMGLEMIVLENDLNSVCGNTTHATAEHLLRLGYRKNQQPVASVPQDVEQFANDVAEWSQTQFEDVIRVSHFREFMRQRDAGHARVPVEKIEPTAGARSNFDRHDIDVNDIYTPRGF